MKNKQKGFIVPIVIIVAVLIIGGGIYYFTKKAPTTLTETPAITTLVKEDKKTETPVVKKTEIPTQIPVIQKQVAPPAPKKNIYTNTASGYSMELPENWEVNNKPEISDPNEPEITGTYFMIKGLTRDQMGFTFDIDTSTTKHRIDYYKQQYNKTPTYEDLFNSFIEDQKTFQDRFALQNTKKVTINNHEAYEITATYNGGTGFEKFYIFYTSKNTYVLMIQALASTWGTKEKMVSDVIGTFKIQ